MKKEYKKYLEKLEGAINQYNLLDEILNGEDFEVNVEYFPKGESDEKREARGKKKKIHIHVQAIKDEVMSSIVLLRAEQERYLDELVAKLDEESNESC